MEMITPYAKEDYWSKGAGRSPDQIGGG